MAGFSVIGMDLFGDRDARAACEEFCLISPEQASDAQLLSEKVNAVAAHYQTRPWFVGGLGSLQDDSINVAPSPRGLSRFCDGLPISVPRISTEIPVNHKIPIDNSSAERILGHCGSEPSVPNRRATQWPNQWPTRWPTRWLLKQKQSCGGLGVRYWDPLDAQASEAIKTGKAYLQQFIPGHGYGLVAIADGQATHVLGISRSLRRRIGSRPFVYAGSLGPCWDSTIPIDAMNDLARRVAGEYSIRGLFNLDFIRDRRNHWWLLELNSRPSGSCEVIERSAWHSGRLKPSQSLIQWHINAVEGKQSTWNQFKTIGPDCLDSVHLKQIVFARSEGCFQLPGDVEDLADIPSEQTQIGPGHPIATSVSLRNGENRLLWKEARANSRRIESMVIAPISLQPECELDR